VTSAPDLSVIIPCYNEGDRLGGTFDAIRTFASGTTEFTAGIEWIFVDDGSTDATLALIEEHAASEAGSRVVALPANKGKGAAVAAGDSVARAPIRVFTDCDLSTPLASIEELPGLFEEFGADLVIGSRHTPWSRVVRAQPLLRRLAGRLFSFVMAHFHRSSFTDTQCGFKAWNEEFSRSVVQRLDEAGWSFDLELIGRAESLQSRIVELPVAWTDSRGSKVRAAIDGPRMLRDGVQFWLRYTPRTILALGFLAALFVLLRALDENFAPDPAGQTGHYSSPLIALLGVHLSYLPPRLIGLMFIGLEAVLLGASLVILKRWARYQVGRTSLGITFWLTFFLGFLYTVLAQFEQAGLSLPIFFFCLMSGYSYLFGHRRLSAAWLAVAIEISLFPAFVAGFALLRRDWRFCGWLAGFLLLLVSAPAAYFGWNANWQLHQEFLAAAAGYGSENELTRAVFQSLPAALYRIALRYDGDLARVAMRAGQFLVVVAATVVWWRFRRRLNRDWILVYSFILALTAQIFPYSSFPSMGFFYAPLTLVTMHGWATRSRWPYAASLVGFLLLYSLNAEFIRGGRLNEVVEFASIPTLGIWILLSGAFIFWTRISVPGSKPASHFPALPHIAATGNLRRSEP